MAGGLFLGVRGLILQVRHVAAVDFEILVSRKTFDRNSQVRFHKCLVPTGLQ